MTYDEFLSRLETLKWQVPNRSFAHHNFKGGWQLIYNRMGGRFQRPGKVAFVICVRHICLRNVEGERNAVEKEPFSCPFKFILKEIESAKFSYCSTLLNFDRSELPVEVGWERVLRALDETVPKWLLLQTKETLRQQIRQLGEGGYIERLWLEDLTVALQVAPVEV